MVVAVLFQWQCEWLMMSFLKITWDYDLKYFCLIERLLTKSIFPRSKRKWLTIVRLISFFNMNLWHEKKNFYCNFLRHFWFVSKIWHKSTSMTKHLFIHISHICVFSLRNEISLIVTQNWMESMGGVYLREWKITWIEIVIFNLWL